MDQAFAMTRQRTLKRRFQRAAARGVVIATVAWHIWCATAFAQEALRPEMGKPLQAAQELIKAGKYKEALGKVRDADAVGPRNANETLMVERMRIAAASGAGEIDTAAKAFEIIDASGKISGPDKIRMVESIAGSYYRATEYSKAMQWYQRYFKQGGTSAVNRTLMIQAQYLSGDLAGASRELMVEIEAAERSGATPAEDRINLLLNAAAKRKDVAAENFALERLVTYYPKKAYWVNLLDRLQRKPGFSDRLLLDTYRLSLATDAMSSPNDYMEMAQLTLQAGLLAEGKAVLDKGFAAAVLGAGPQAERHQRLRDLVMKRLSENALKSADEENLVLAAKDGNGLVAIGMNAVSSGQAAKGVQLIQQGIRKGGLNRADDARLHLGIALLAAGDHAKAQATFKSVAGTDGTGDLARLWAIHANHAMRAKR